MASYKQMMPDEVVRAVGNVTIAAGELEVVLAWIGASQEGGNAFVVLAKPGEPLRAARRSVMSMKPIYRDAFLPLVDRANEVLRKRHSIVHSMWINEAPGLPLQEWRLLSYRTHIRQPADPATLDDITGEIMEVRSKLVHVLTKQINNLPPDLQKSKTQISGSTQDELVKIGS